ncbi:unnamed protein product [Protopolystoma xenopodis]|uniref:Uncharacterized protein n=1 Tax=Protopolystoma xenopodis TaxID=117903 RepID=A0A3S5ANX8_9PLAT|nr:unnamed protein product [Protopolystoma xenopodis]
MCILAVYQNPRDSAYSLFIMLIGIPIYLFGVVWQNKPAFLRLSIIRFTSFCQRLLNVVPPETTLSRTVDQAFSKDPNGKPATENLASGDFCSDLELVACKRSAV